MLEKLDGPGGRAYTFRQDGFTFDAGPTIVTAPYLFDELWQACGARLADDVEISTDTAAERLPSRGAGEAASRDAGYPGVRAALLEYQRAFADRASGAPLIPSSGTTRIFRAGVRVG